MSYNTIYVDNVYPIKNGKLWPRYAALVLFAGMTTYTVYTAVKMPVAERVEAFGGTEQCDCGPPNGWLESEEIASNHWWNRMDTQRLFYNRVPKCGSTTFYALIRKLSVMHGYVHFNSKVYDKKNVGEDEQSRIVYMVKRTPPPCSFDRHLFFINFTRFGEKPPIYINVIRDPVERIISSFFYRRMVALKISNVNKTSSKVKPSAYWLNKKFEHCVMTPDPECTFIDGKNYSVLQLPYFCGQEFQCQLLNDPGALQKAKYNIDRAYAVVGVLEHINITLKVLEAVLPQFFGGALQLYQTIEVHLNKNIQKQHVSEEVKSLLRGNLTAEYELYGFVLKRLYNQYKNILQKEEDWFPKDRLYQNDTKEIANIT